MYSKLLKSIFIVLILFFAGNNVYAQVDRLGLAVSPQIFELDALLGETINSKIKIRNTSEVAVPINIRAVNFSAAEESGDMIFEQGLDDISIASYKWLKIETPDFILDPEEKRDVHFSINIPDNAEPGGHYVVMLFEPQLPSFYFREGEPRSIPVMGVLFLLSVKSLSLDPVAMDEQIQIVEFGVPAGQRMQNLEKALASIIDLVPSASAMEINVVDKTPSSFVLRIKNNDIFHHKLTGDLFVYNTFGEKVGKAEIERTTILPGKIREFPVDFQVEEFHYLKWLPAGISNFLVQNTSLGKYKAELVLEVDNLKEKQQLSVMTDFWAIPWKIGFIILSLAMGLFFIRRRIASAVKALLGLKPKL